MEVNKEIPTYERTRRVRPEELERLKELTREQRVVICKADFALFSAYYFAHTKKYPFAVFHYDFFRSFRRLIAGMYTEVMLLAFRESAKTSLVKEFVIYLIAYNLEDYIVWDSFDLTNSKRALFDIVVELQTNRRLKEDFGDLYNAKRQSDEITQKSVSDFITNPVRDIEGNIVSKGIRIEAHSTQEPARGFLHGGKRPGLVILDDFENNKTIRSEALTLSIWQHIQELKGGIDGIQFRVLYLGNYISQFANIQKIIDRQKVDTGLKVHIVPVIKDGVSTWHEKYTLTDKEALLFRELYPFLTPKASLETRKRLLWSPDTGDQDWEAEMMCNPIDNLIAVFKRQYFQYINLDDVLKKKVACFVSIDPALSQQDKSDDTGVSIVWTDEINNWYAKVFKIRINSKELINFLFNINDYLTALGTPPRKIGIEKEKYYGAVYPFLKERMQKKDRYLPIFPIEIKGRKKEDRITDALRYRYENGVIWHVMGEMNIGQDDTIEGSINIQVPYTMTDYETQAQRFPAGGHDDMLDSFAYGADIIRYDAPESEDEKRIRANPYNLDSFVERIEKQNKERGMVEEEYIEQLKYKAMYEDDESIGY